MSVKRRNYAVGYKYERARQEMLSRGFKAYQVADIMFLVPITLSKKLRGKSDFLLREAVEFKKIIGTDLSLEELFEVSE